MIRYWDFSAQWRSSDKVLSPSTYILFIKQNKAVFVSSEWRLSQQEAELSRLAFKSLLKNYLRCKGRLVFFYTKYKAWSSLCLFAVCECKIFRILLDLMHKSFWRGFLFLHRTFINLKVCINWSLCLRKQNIVKIVTSLGALTSRM